jgi:hypothetical protein
MGTQELKLCVSDLMSVAIVLAGLLKDGVQVADIGALLASEPFKAAASDLFKNFSAATKEVGSLVLTDDLEIAMAAIQKVPELIAALKKA